MSRLSDLYEKLLDPNRLFEMAVVTEIEDVQQRVTNLEAYQDERDNLGAQIERLEEQLQELREEVQDLRDQVTKIVYDLYEAAPPAPDVSPAPVQQRGRDKRKRHSYTVEQKLTAMYNQLNEMRLPKNRRRCVVCGDPIAKGHQVTCKKRQCRLIQHATANMRMLGWTDEKVEEWHRQHPSHPEHLTIIAGEGVRDADRS